MILSHAHKFIYIKTIKTASSSIEAALSTVCGPDDVITPTRDDLLALRDARGPQNYRIDHPAKPKIPLYRKLLRRPERHYHPTVGFYEHMPAWRVKTYVGDAVWNSYFKFSFERNPWDRQVSFYYFRSKNRGREETFAQFVADAKRSSVDNWGLYTLDDTPALDFIGRYETLEDDFEKVKQACGLPESLSLPVHNTSQRTSGYVEYYDDPQLIETIATRYAKEIAHFSYGFEPAI
ncbi:MAG: sulfotransferase family 2 domain-containing protein [Pseudomonadota bacterium]